MKPSELFALNYFLYKFPQDKSFNEIMKLIDQGSEEIAISLRYTIHKDIVNEILMLSADIDRKFISFHELVTIIDRDSVFDMLTVQLERKPTHDELKMVCSFLDTHFSCNLPIKIAEALKQLSIKN